jgi:hypothetical protein
LAGCCDDTHGYAESHADDDRNGGKLEGRRENPNQVFEHRPRRQDRSAEIAVEQLDQIVPILLVEGEVQAKLHPHALIDVGQRPVANHSQHRVDRNDPSDAKGDDGEAQKSECKRCQQPHYVQENCREP